MPASGRCASTWPAGQRPVARGTGVQIGWVQVTGDGDVELRLTGAAMLPPPWTGGGQGWRLDADVPIELLGEDARRVGLPCIALVQLGVSSSGADVFVDLEACSTLAIEAPNDQADEVVMALATGLASSMYAEVAHLIGVSLPSEPLLGHRNAHHADSVTAAFDLASGLVARAAGDERTTFELRSLHTGGEMWEPAVILLTSDDSPAATEPSRPCLPLDMALPWSIAVGPGGLRGAPARLVGSIRRMAAPRVRDGHRPHPDRHLDSGPRCDRRGARRRRPRADLHRTRGGERDGVGRRRR